MKPSAQRLVDYLAHIQQAIQRIHQYTEDVDQLGFLKSPLIQDAVIRNIEIIGEASHNIQKHFPKFAQTHPEIPLRIAYEMRNAVAHGYFKVDLEIVWKTMLTDLPDLESTVTRLLDDPQVT
ncbi:DUF86 domain-containing protein [Methylophilus methylotrophus]|uniref:HepT-like ribonuclease domain-containing protein n=1 Tax=Methylophilus methylotrophus TaxID=17 RepID=UPI000F5B5F04|nr:DUF86 domain-containing protein [Methylophilus methylotrophus]